MAYDAYLDLSGVESESTREGFENKIELIAFNLGASNPSTIGQGGGGGQGRVTVSPFSFTKRTDKSSPQLFQAVASGRHFEKAVVTLHKAGGNSQIDYLQYTFQDVFIDSISWAGQSGGDDVPLENVAFSYGRVEVTYTPQKSDGSKGSPVVGAWDQKKVKAA
ncbi:MAG: type VI secretion system tube protein Hcp [Gemmatimonadaceae bacterium]|jgi:type VI secretion system secreted protein Hcp|nr:type VI secretion system tube protein Hcp [Gemmatimonadaceae bacterium]